MCGKWPVTCAPSHTNCCSPSPPSFPDASSAPALHSTSYPSTAPFAERPPHSLPLWHIITPHSSCHPSQTDKPPRAWPGGGVDHSTLRHACITSCTHVWKRIFMSGALYAHLKGNISFGHVPKADVIEYPKGYSEFLMHIERRVVTTHQTHRCNPLW